MATDWRWCWTPKRHKVHLPTFTTGFVLPSIKIVYYQHLLVSFEGLLSLRLSDHFALVVGCINNNWLKGKCPYSTWTERLLIPLRWHSWKGGPYRKPVGQELCRQIQNPPQAQRQPCVTFLLPSANAYVLIYGGKDAFQAPLQYTRRQCLGVDVLASLSMWKSKRSTIRSEFGGAQKLGSARRTEGACQQT